LQRYRAIGIPASVDERQPTTTTPAVDEPGKQRPSAPTRLHATALAIGVDGKRGLVPLVLGPSGVALVVILEQDVPALKRFAVPVAPADMAVHEASQLGAFGRGIKAGCAAAKAAPSEPRSNGQTEGQIAKLKLVKRQMYAAK